MNEKYKFGLCAYCKYFKPKTSKKKNGEKGSCKKTGHTLKVERNPVPELFTCEFFKLKR